jgi:hypothetical protein
MKLSKYGNIIMRIRVTFFVTLYTALTILTLMLNFFVKKYCVLYFYTFFCSNLKHLLGNFCRFSLSLVAFADLSFMI